MFPSSGSVAIEVELLISYTRQVFVHLLLISRTNFVNDISHLVKFIRTNVWTISKTKVYHIIAASKFSIAEFFL